MPVRFMDLLNEEQNVSFFKEMRTIMIGKMRFMTDAGWNSPNFGDRPLDVQRMRKDFMPYSVLILQHASPHFDRVNFDIYYDDVSDTLVLYGEVMLNDIQWNTFINDFHHVRRYLMHRLKGRSVEQCDLI